ncbi:hypothetical protein [Aggregatibacter actinomycetemcomitans]|uniref:Lipoprotein, putative n=1 Tax=Aggregatibacter actinomycetemcomitans TaxID=714 RepID=S4WAI5_AGGAC|nr:hypothetical protein [Aggregatibacter actinomycetemcomitans]AEW77953.1 lipoprotein, putative [Aggregatibacter actinomycetemcomitans ANH9381]AGO88185.1 lipoprotein, putative [Aggregatibacter actinomycetemcomitans]AMQ92034.1 hypothetical protein ACT74_05200 [Aggregatibacter actinomycetemcomitans]KOE52194.1 hypothetical protein S23A_0210235 [Aggregatibacter actinomycetemcomitans serotype b str. S23A]KOE53017.1 hypothetical protein I23C_0307035 [Aggregatibacter actinomycetemcomitans serotype b 
MQKYITRVVLCSSILLLSACGSLSEMKTAGTSGSVTEVMQANADVKALLQKAETLPTFEYVDNNTQYTAYLNGQPELIKVSNGSDNKLFFYKGGKVSVVQENGKVHNIDAANQAQKALVAEAMKLYKMLGSNNADKGVVNVKTGNDAKLNYLCIAKIQQVAQTSRVFRSSANHANSNSRLTADVRLNGNRFHKMDCRLAGNRVAKLSLIKK